ncbi:hypothetical protein [Mycobacterium sp.]
MAQEPRAESPEAHFRRDVVCGGTPYPGPGCATLAAMLKDATPDAVAAVK